MTQTVSLSFFEFDRWSARLWAFAMMGLARRPLARLQGIEFWKLCGAGTGEGFTPIPNSSVCAILASWQDETTARHQTTQSRLFQRYHQKAAQSWTVYLSTTSARGEWSGHTPFTPQDRDVPGPLAALTRATVKPRIALSFWNRVPDISRVIGKDPNVIFKMGIGEVPLMQQITFSIWPDAKTMANFARKDGPHARAIASVRSGQWFKEELYARFHVLGDHGTWGGTSPLQALDIKR